MFYLILALVHTPPPLSAVGLEKKCEVPIFILFFQCTLDGVPTFSRVCWVRCVPITRVSIGATLHSYLKLW